MWRLYLWPCIQDSCKTAWVSADRVILCESADSALNPLIKASAFLWTPSTETLAWDSVPLQPCTRCLIMLWPTRAVEGAPRCMTAARTKLEKREWEKWIIRNMARFSFHFQSSLSHTASSAWFRRSVQLPSQYPQPLLHPPPGGKVLRCVRRGVNEGDSQNSVSLN